MDNKIKRNPGEVFRTFSHKAKINPGNVNDDELMRDIEEITAKISLEEKDDIAMPFCRSSVSTNDLRADEMGVMNSHWIAGANETKDGFICVSEIMDGKDKK